MADGGRVDFLDGIRAVAIAAVLAVHWLSWYSPLLHGGSVGVDVFFVLSGFIITTLLRRRAGTGPAVAQWWSFVKRRVVRLYPALLGVVAGAVVLYAVTPGASLGFAEVARRGAVVIGQGTSPWAATQGDSFWLPALHPFPHAWSLAVEWYFYLLWPVVVLVGRSRGVTARGLMRGTLVAAGSLYAASLFLGHFWFYFGPSARSAELLAGAALALWLQSDRRPVARWRHADAAAVAALAAICAITVFGPSAHGPLYRYVEAPVTVLATVLLIHAGYSNPGNRVSRLLSHPWLVAVGRRSYSLYLWHLVPFVLLEDAWSEAPKPVLGALVLASTALFTALSYRYLEQPFLRGRGDALRARPRRRDLDVAA